MEEDIIKNLSLEEIKELEKRLKERKQKLLEEAKREKRAEELTKAFSKFMGKYWDDEIEWDYIEEHLEEFDRDIRHVFEQDHWDDDDLKDSIQDTINHIQAEIQTLTKFMKTLQATVEHVDEFYQTMKEFDVEDENL